MTRYFLQRAIHSILLLFLVSIATFTMIHSAPGGPAFLMDPEIGKEQALQIMEEIGLTDPIHVQYVRWIGNAARGNFGLSFSKGRPVRALVTERLPATLQLMLASIIVALSVAIPVGIISAVRRRSAADYLGTFFSFFGVSVPVFWYGLMLMIVFAVNLRWLPTGGISTIGVPPSLIDRLRHLTLPCIVLSTTAMAQLMRYTRSSMLSVLQEDFIRTARSKGLAERVVLYKHALRNALIPVMTVLGMTVPRLVGGAAITETIFGWPGMGRLAVEAAFQRDYPVIMMITLVVSVVVVISNCIIDFFYTVLDPRIRLYD